MRMVELLLQLFKIWETSNSFNIDDSHQERLTDEWSKLCWQIQIQLLLAAADKSSYQNAIAALSEQIYTVYRKHSRSSNLHKLLLNLENLLEDREQPTKFKLGLLKSAIACESRAILFAIKSRAVSSDLIHALQYALSDLNRNFPVSKRIAEYLHAFSFWCLQQHSLSNEQFVDHLILINFNHPQVIEYIIQFYEIPEYPDALDKLYELQKKQMGKQRHFEYLNLISTATLFFGHPTIVINLINLVKVDLDFVRKQMKRQLLETKMKDSIHVLPSQIVNKKGLTKWPSEKSDLVELAYAMYIYMRARGSQITITMLIKWFEDTFGVTLSRYSHRFAEIKMRKSTRPSKFLDAMVREFLDYVENSDAFQPDTLA